jgi:hypothetical protein
MEIFIVEDPEYRCDRLKYFPPVDSDHLYKDMGKFCKDISLHSVPIPKIQNILAFLHGSNSEAKWNQPLNGMHGWTKGVELIAYVTLRVCKAGGRVVIFSGGEPKYDQKKLERLLEDFGFKKGHHFDFISIDKIKKDHRDLKRFDKIPENWNVNILGKRLEKSDVLRYFTELHVLLQGYLLIMKPGILLSDYEKSVEKPGNIGLDLCRIRESGAKKLEKDKLFRTADNYHGPEDTRDFGDFWFDECLPAVKEKRFSKLKEAEPLLRYCRELEKLWKLLRRECGNKEIFDKEGAAQDDYTCLFEKAYDDLLWLFNAKKKADELENKRNILNHNRLKNEFIQEITPGLEANKGEYICLYWEKLCGESAAKIEEDVLASRIGSIDDAFSFWPDLEDEINSFFNSVIRDYGFEFTGKGEKLKIELIDNKKSSLAIVDNFIKEFKKIAKESKSVRNKRLEEFFMALDNMHEKISDMSLGRNPGNIFNGYLAPLKK